MKTNVIIASSFVAGAIIGAAIVFMLSNCCYKTICQTDHDFPVVDTSAIRLISVQQANTYFNAYMKNPDSVVPFKAFSINAQQFYAMKLIADNDTSVHGFRIYMGMDNMKAVRMVVGTGSPDIVKTIYITDESGSGPCPRLCDDESPIME
ncbi:MAG: hypothetical protein Q8M08_01605 [Bacteroidales bacterium]|nr:hypothetical protein [Bacteroidales bacterium]